MSSSLRRLLFTDGRESTYTSSVWSYNPLRDDYVADMAAEADKAAAALRSGDAEEALSVIDRLEQRIESGEAVESMQLWTYENYGAFRDDVRIQKHEWEAMSEEARQAAMRGGFFEMTPDRFAEFKRRLASERVRPYAWEECQVVRFEALAHLGRYREACERWRSRSHPPEYESRMHQSLMCAHLLSGDLAAANEMASVATTDATAALERRVVRARVLMAAGEHLAASRLMEEERCERDAEAGRASRVAACVVAEAAAARAGDERSASLWRARRIMQQQL